MRALLAALLLPFAALAADAPTREMPEDNGPWVVQAWYDDKAGVQRLARRTAPWQVRHDQGYVVVELRNRYEYQQLLQDGFRARIDPDLTWMLRNPHGSLRSVPGFACYRTVEETLDALTQMAHAHPDLASVIDIGESWERVQDPDAGHPLRVLKLSNQQIAGTKPKLFLLGAIHAREYTTAELLTRFAESLLERYADDADVRWMLDHHELHILPQGNPDGRKKAETGLFWRKTTNQAYCGATSNSRGADMNRNFPFEWGAHGGSSGSQCNEVYRGPSAKSEPETDAITAYLASIYSPTRPPDLVTPADPETSGVFIDVHSFGSLVLWPWGFTATTAPNAAALEQLGHRLAWFNNYTPSAAIELYATDGTTDDFVYGELGVPAYTFELGNQFFETCEQFENRVLPDNLPALEYALRVARRPYIEPAGPSVVDLRSSPVEVGETFRISAEANDSLLGVGATLPATQPIQGAQLYLDIAPFLPGASVAAQAQPADGLYDQERELLAGEISSAGMAVGRHPLYARASDSADAGPVSALFLDVLASGSSGRLSGRLRDANSGETLAVPGIVRLDQSASPALPHEGASYSLRALPGNYSVSAQAPGYAPVQIDNLVFAAGGDATLDIELMPICTILADDASNGLVNFTAQVPWGITSTPHFSPPSAFADSPGGNYAPNTNASLTMLALDLRDFTHIHLQFQSLCETEGGLDFGRVEYSTDGSQWNQIWSCSGDPQWRTVDLPLPMLDGLSVAYLRFRFTSNGNIQLPGWSIDDIVLSGAGELCQGPSGAVFGSGFE